MMNLGKSKCTVCIRVFNPDYKQIFSINFNSGCRQVVGKWHNLQIEELRSIKYWILHPGFIRKQEKEGV